MYNATEIILNGKNSNWNFENATKTCKFQHLFQSLFNFDFNTIHIPQVVWPTNLQSSGRVQYHNDYFGFLPFLCSPYHLTTNPLNFSQANNPFHHVLYIQ